MNLTDILGPHGMLAQSLPGFAFRGEQLAMAEQVASAIAQRRHLIVEAGTGVGKTFAYLIPALLAGKRVIISTGTRSLQDQLYSRDLPMITAVLGRPVRIALLKGRANYLCRERLELADGQAGARGVTRELARSLQTVKLWSQQTRRGDIAELAAVAEGDPVWPWVTSTRDNCVGAECDWFERCHVVAARREAQAADIVVVNHHLLMADLLLKERGFGDLLPGADAIVVDEAHQLPDVATQAFGTNLSARQLREFVRDTLSWIATHDRHAVPDSFLTRLQQLESTVQDAARALSLLPNNSEASRWPDVLHDALLDAQPILQLFASSGAGDDEAAELRALRERAAQLAQRCELFAAQPVAGSEPKDVRWSTLTTQGFVLHHAPIDIAGSLGDLLRNQDAAWIFASATLAVGDDLAPFARRIGLPEAQTTLFGSPFDFQRQALMYLPRALDNPSSPEHTRQVIETALPVLHASGGRAFLLFTSHRALREAAERLRALWAFDAPFPLLVQGDAPRDQLLRRFRELGNAVLLGTGSFWEGVDVKGEALCVVLIDKLPFAMPDDPLMKARLAAIEARGGNAFMEEQVPQAVMTLKQGAGRLIRDPADFGVIVLCDPRVTTRSYGAIFLSSLPPMPRTSDLHQVQSFLFHHLRRSDADSDAAVTGVLP